MKGDDPCRFRQVQRMGEGMLSASRHTRTVSSSSLAITGLPSRSTPTAIGLADQLPVHRGDQAGRVQVA
jgi:hypothetical protein